MATTSDGGDSYKDGIHRKVDTHNPLSWNNVNSNSKQREDSAGLCRELLNVNNGGVGLAMVGSKDVTNLIHAAQKSFAVYSFSVNSCGTHAEHIIDMRPIDMWSIDSRHNQVDP
ncbi:hypothetical protein RIF29_20052 [Crotalaria pallida]|uniref:Uncharacterized protein n=1 Tax=Crotalaria pallida TaxID=3830 RepID=A0AAN9F2R4_CROPI